MQISGTPPMLIKIVLLDYSLGVSVRVRMHAGMFAQSKRRFRCLPSLASKRDFMLFNISDSFIIRPIHVVLWRLVNKRFSNGSKVRVDAHLGKIWTISPGDVDVAARREWMSDSEQCGFKVSACFKQRAGADHFVLYLNGERRPVLLRRWVHSFLRLFAC